MVDTYTGAWHDVTATALGPTADWSNKVELADVDTDGDVDLDMVLADWGRGSPMKNDGGVVTLWLTDGSGRCTDATRAQMPTTCAIDAAANQACQPATCSLPAQPG